MSELTSIEVARVVAHRDWLPGFRSAVRSDLDAARERVRQAQRHADNLVQEARAELERLREELHDRDSSVTHADVREAERYLCDCEAYAETVGGLGARTTSRIADIESRFEPAWTAAIGDVDSELALFRRYDAIAVTVDGASVGPAGAGAIPSAAVAGANGRAVKSSEGLPALPGGMKWIAIDQLNWADVPDHLEFNKAPRAAMESMLLRFSGDVLPLMRDPRGITRDELAQLDQMRGSAQSPPGDSLAFAWDCMVGGNDPIVLNAPHPLTGPQFGWTSGRHRAVIARQLGWTHIPARVI